MKYWIIIFIFSGYNAKGQTLREWTAQNETALEYAREQLRILGEGQKVLTQGYSILKKGLGVWNNLKNEESAAHASHFEKRKEVDPKSLTQAYQKEAAQINQLLWAIKTSDLYRSSLFSPSEKAHIMAVFKGMERSVAQVIQSVEALGKDNALHMNPGERQMKAGRLKSEWSELKKEIISFHQSNKVLIYNRQSAEAQRIQLSKWESKK